MKPGPRPDSQEKLRTVEQQRVIQAGTTHHAALEAEVEPEGELVEVALEGAEDVAALRLLSTVLLLLQLQEEGISREIPVFGKLQVPLPGAMSPFGPATWQ